MAKDDNRGIDAATAGAVAAAIGFFVYRVTRKVLIVPVGESGSGKTTFANYMTGSPIPDSHLRTQVGQEKAGDRLEGFLAPKLAVADTVGGSDGWKDAEKRASKARLVCFFVAWPRLAAGSVQLIRAAEQVASWESRATRVVVVTFRDQAGQVSDEAILSDPTVRAIRQRLGASQAFVIDQTDPASRDALRSQLLPLVS